MKKFHVEDGILCYVNPKTAGEFVIPEGVTEIADQAFYDCSQLTGVKIPDTVTTIGALAFEGCSSLKEVILPDSVTSLGEGAFANCENLESIDLSSNIKNLEDVTFSNCKKLKHVSGLDSVETIGSKAFYFAGLEAISLPKGLTTLADNAFYGTKIKKVTFNGSVENIVSQAFVGANDISELEFNFNGKNAGVINLQQNKSRLPMLRKPLMLTVVPDAQTKGYNVYLGNDDTNLADEVYKVSQNYIQKFEKTSTGFDYKTRQEVPVYTPSLIK
ncbi:MAG: leucine-rich repeat domain-containing protein [Clostridiales bacterium]|jgi:hypothetical protein|nr:leucine-rich repeat domain-containing protein [Clostridiales bacterium]